MKPISSSERIARLLVSGCALAAGSAALIAILLRVLARWWDWAAEIRPHFAMALHTATLLILLSAGLFTHIVRPGGRGGRIFGGLIVGITAAIALLVIARPGLPVGFEFEEWLCRVITPWNTNSPGHMSPHTAWTFLCAAGALACLLYVSGNRKWGRHLAFLMGAAAFSSGAVSVLGFVLGTPLLYGQNFSSMKGLTATIFIALTAGLMLAAFPKNWVLQGLAGEADDSAQAESRRFRRASVILLLFLAAGIGTAGFYFLRREQVNLRARAEQGLAAIAELKAAQVADWRRERMKQANLLLYTPYVARRASDIFSDNNSAVTRRIFSGWLQSFLPTGPYAEALLLDSKLNVALTYPARTNCVLSESEFRAAELTSRTLQVGMVDLHLSPENPDSIYVSLVVPLVARWEGRTITLGTSEGASGMKPDAVLILRVNAGQTLFPMVKSWPASGGSLETMLVRAEGTNGLYLSELRFQTNAALKLQFPMTQVGTPTVPGAIGKERVLAGLDYRGVMALAATRHVPHSRWSVIAKMDEKEIFAPVRERGRDLGIILAVLVLAAMLGLHLLWRQRDVMFLRQQVAKEHEGAMLAQRLAHLMKHANDIIIITDGHWRILEVNDRALESYGYSPVELRQMRVMELRSPEARAEFPAFEMQFRAQGQVLVQTTHQRKDGSTFPAEISARKVEIGGHIHTLAIIRDITERVRAEQELRDSEGRYRSVVDTARDAIFTITLEGKFTSLNPAFEALSGWAREDWIGRDFSDLVHPDDVALAKEVANQVANGDKASTLEVRVRKKSGEFMVVQVLGAPQIHDGKVCAVLGIARDVTVAKQMERSLRESEEKLSLALNASHMGVWDWNLQTNAVTWSPECFAIFGVKSFAENVEAFTATVHPEDRGRMMRAVDSALEKKAQYAAEFRIVLPGGEARWVSNLGKATYDEQGKPVRLIGTVLNITERKKAEEELVRLNESLELRVRERTAELMAANAALRESEAQLLLALSASDAGTWSWEIATNRTTWDARYHAQYGFGSDDPISHEAWLSRIHPDDREHLRQRIKELFEPNAGSSWNEDFRVLHPTKGLRWMTGLGRLERGPDGRAVRFAGINLDTTERKQAEETLKASEARNRLLSERTFEGILIHEHGRIVDCNLSFAGMFGYDPAEIMGLDALQLVAPDSREMVRCHIQNGATEPYEATGLRKDSSTFVMEIRGRSFVQGDRTLRFASCRDVTERKRIEREIRQLNESLERRVEERTAQLNAAYEELQASQRRISETLAFNERILGTSSVGILTYHESGPCRFANEAGAKIVGTTVATLLAQNFHQIDAWKTSGVYAVAVKALATDAEQHIEARVHTAFGKDLWLNFRFSTFQSVGDKHLLVFMYDITERKRLEQLLIEVSDREQARIGQDIHDGLCQLLVTAAFDANTLRERLAEKLLPEAKVAAALHLLLDETITHSRQVARGLFPVKLEANGLSAALEELAVSTTVRSRVKCQARGSRQALVHDNAVAIHLYRIAQEAVNNSVRHASAKNIEINLTADPARIKLTVMDDGVGLLHKASSNSGMGLHIMEYRARTIGGTLEIGVSASGGTAISCCVPRHEA